MSDEQRCYTCKHWGGSREAPTEIVADPGYYGDALSHPLSGSGGDCFWGITLEGDPIPGFFGCILWELDDDA